MKVDGAMPSCAARAATRDWRIASVTGRFFVDPPIASVVEVVVEAAAEVVVVDALVVVVVFCVVEVVVELLVLLEQAASPTAASTKAPPRRAGRARALRAVRVVLMIWWSLQVGRGRAAHDLCRTPDGGALLASTPEGGGDVAEVVPLVAVALRPRGATRSDSRGVSVHAMNVAARARPNVVLINCDDLGYGDLGCYGSTRNQTPAIDALAAEGMRFTSFYMASPVCSPSRAALLTGCYPPRIGFGSFDGLPVLFPGQPMGLPDTEVTIAKILKEAGYRTQMIGKWHCGDQPDFLPTNHGFDHYFGLPYSNDMGRQMNPPAILDFLPPLPLLRDHEVIEQQPDQRSLTGRYVAEARTFIQDARDEPFFLYLAHMYVHLPIYVQPEFLERSTNGPYGAAVASIDWATSVLLEELRALGLEEQTIVIFTSDNGSLGDEPPPWGGRAPLGGSNLPLRGKKGTTFEGGMRVPAIVRWPGVVEPGQIVDELMSSLDLLPTLATLCGAHVPTDRSIDGHDVSGLWRGEDTRSPTGTFAYYRGNDLEAVRDSRHKLFVARAGQELTELYDLRADPGETTDVAAQLPEVVAQLRAVADAYRAELGDGRLGIEGSGARPIGRVDYGATLTTFDPDHPYFMAEYDLEEKG